VENFTIADYGEGEKPLFDGNKVQPLIISDSKNVIVKNIDISGQEWQIDISSNIYVENVEGLVIDGVYGNGHTTKGKGKSEGKTAITINAGSGEIEIKNCEIFNWGPYDLPKIDTEDFMGIALMNMDIGEYKIHDNKIYNINADAIHVSLTNAQGAIYDNILYNSGADAIDITGSENCEIYDNEFYRTAEFLGEGGKGSGGLPTYINLHEGEERVSKNITINSNNFKDGDCVAIKLGNAENTNIYENNFSNVKSALYIQDLVTNTVFHHNIIENPQSRPTENGFDAGSIYENNSYTGTQIYNNTIYNGKGDCKHLIALECSNKTSIYNNIAYQNNSSEDAFGLYHNSCVTGTEPVISNNYWYNPGKINRTKYSNEIYTANMQEEWNEKHSSGDKFDAPLMNDPEEGDYSLYEKNLKRGAVYDETAVSVASTDESEVIADVSVAETDKLTTVKRSYYVTQEGAGLKNGTTLDNAWSISDFNNSSNWSAIDSEKTINPGDTVYLSGVFTDSFDVKGSGAPGEHIVIDGSDATIQVPILTNSKIFKVFNVQYITFRNLDIDGQDSDMDSPSNRAAIYVREFGLPTGYITIEDSNIIQTSSAIILQGNVNHVNIFRNTFEKMSYHGVSMYADHYDDDDLWYYDDCPSYITVGGSTNDGNVFKNIGKRIGTENIPGQVLGTLGTDIIFSYNTVYADIDDVGTGIYMNGAKRVLVEYNDIHSLEAKNHRSYINFKCDPLESADGQLLYTEDIIIRFNKVHDVYYGINEYAMPEHAIRISGRGKDRIVYGNFLNGGGIGLNWNWTEENEGIGGEGYYVWANIIFDTAVSGGISISGYSGNNDTFKDFYIFNNTIYNVIQEHASSTSYDYGIGMVDRSLYVVRNLNINNNIAVNVKPNSTEYINYRVPYLVDSSFDYNHQHFAGQTPKVIIINSPNATYDWDRSDLPGGYGTNDTSGDPKFSNAANGDFALTTGSPCIGSGINLAGISIPEISIQGTLYKLNSSLAIDPATDWSATPTPANIVTSDRANNTNWDQGAYIFKNEGL
jgi:hypothetical protein